ncbi:MAG: DUF3592 domain-containing protein [Cyanobacteria bacterium J06635_10]
MLLSVQPLLIFMDKFFYYLLISLFICIFSIPGLILLFCGIGIATDSIQASNWPSVMGKITNLSLQKQISSDSDGTTTEIYEVKVEYSYSVMDRTYNSSRLAFGYGSSSGKPIHQEIFDKLESASSVKVRYSPKNPEISTLSFGIHRSIQFVLGFAIIWLLSVTLVAWVGFHPDSVLLKNMEVILK